VIVTLAGLKIRAAPADHMDAGSLDPRFSLDTHSLTDIAQHHDVPPESLAALVRARVQQARVANGEPPVDQATLDRVLDASLDHASVGDSASEAEEPPSPAYTSRATVAPLRPTGSAGISIYA
jgi:hypothetical protein